MSEITLRSNRTINPRQQDCIIIHRRLQIVLFEAHPHGETLFIFFFSRSAGISLTMCFWWQAAIPLETGTRCCLLFRLHDGVPRDENILFDVPPRLLASAFSINAKRSVLSRHPTEHFTSHSKMACVCQKRHVSYWNSTAEPGSIERRWQE